MGDQEYFYEQYQQDQFDKGKYSKGLSLFPNNYNHIIHIAWVTLLRIS